MAQVTVAAPPMCSFLTKTAGEDPIGSIGSFKHLIMIEVPLPWPRVVRAARRFPPAVETAIATAEAAGTSPSFLFAVPNPAYAPPDHTRVLQVRRHPGAPWAAEKADYLVPLAALGDLVTALTTDPTRLDDFARWREDSTAVRDLLVCTHGTRDRCCASLGYPLYNRLRRELQADPDPRTRVWRVGHIGGHRFAPTLIDLPSGRYWAHLDDDDAILRLLYRDAAPPNLARHYRGWAALGSLPEMVAERALFDRFGWAWTRQRVSSEIVSPTDAADQTVVRLTYDSPAGGTRYADLTVAPTGVVTRTPGSCGDDKISEHRQFAVCDWSEHVVSA